MIVLTFLEDGWSKEIWSETFDYVVETQGLEKDSVAEFSEIAKVITLQNIKIYISKPIGIFPP